MVLDYWEAFTSYHTPKLSNISSLLPIDVYKAGELGIIILNHVPQHLTKCYTVFLGLSVRKLRVNMILRIFTT